MPPEHHESQVPPILYYPFVDGDITNAELSTFLINFIQVMTAQFHVINNYFISQANKGYRPQQDASTPASRIRDFMRMKPTTFHGTKVDEDPQCLIDEVFNVVDAMGVTPKKKAYIAFYKLRDVDQVWFVKLTIHRLLERVLVYSEGFKEDFLDRFFPLKWREKNMVEVMNLRQGGMSVREYSQIHPTL